MTTPYNPHWPFPQYDENGQRLLPPGFDLSGKPTKPTKPDLSDMEEAPL